MKISKNKTFLSNVTRVTLPNFENLTFPDSEVCTFSFDKPNRSKSSWVRTSD